MNTHISNFPPLSGSKRPRIAYSNENKKPDFDRFFIVRRLEDNFSKVSPFLINKVLTSLVGDDLDIKKLKDGTLLVQVNSPKQSDKILKITSFHDFGVVVSPHPSLNFCRGVITSSDLLNCDLDEIVDNLKLVGVTTAKRITTRKDGELTNTASIILTFRRASLPASIKAGYLSLKVRPYIPNPLRCFNCQKFGHISSTCSGNQTCPSCGHGLHEGDCSLPPSCINCNGEHSPRYKGCPIYQYEMKVNQIKITEKISYFAAKAKVGNPLFAPDKSFAAATKKSVTSIAIQCDLHRPTSKDVPLKTSSGAGGIPSKSSTISPAPGPSRPRTASSPLDSSLSSSASLLKTLSSPSQSKVPSSQKNPRPPPSPIIKTPSTDKSSLSKPLKRSFKKSSRSSSSDDLMEIYTSHKN